MDDYEQYEQRKKKTLIDIKHENDAYREPCGEFIKLRELLDAAGIPWSDASTIQDYYVMHRTHGDGFSVIYGFGSYGCEDRLLEVITANEIGATGNLTAVEAFRHVLRQVFGLADNNLMWLYKHDKWFASMTMLAASAWLKEKGQTLEDDTIRGLQEWMLEKHEAE